MNRFEQLRASGELPSPRGVALAIIRLNQQEEVSIAELARVIAGDPAFVGRLIKAANGLIGFNRRPVVSVSEALMVLGLPAVRSMALGFSLLSDYRSGGCREFDYDLYWLRSFVSHANRFVRCGSGNCWSSRLLDHALELQPQMVVASCAAGEEPGLATVCALRKMRIGEPIYLLFATQVEDEQGLLDAFEAGVDDFVARAAGPRVLVAWSSPKGLARVWFF